VTTTAASASVEVKTSVPAAVTVKASKLDAQLGLAAGPAPKDVVVPSFQTIRTVLLPGLEPATTYRIVVSARDMQGYVHTRSGTFTTREVKVAVPTPTGNLAAGLGCKADCIEKGTLTSDPSVPGRAGLELESSVPATFQVKLVAQNGSHQLIHSTGSRTTRHSAMIDGLLAGTTYLVTAKATDAEGHSHVEQGTFRTRSATAVVTFHKVKVLADGDKGANRGEIALSYYAGGLYVHGSDFQRIGSGEEVRIANGKLDQRQRLVLALCELEDRSYAEIGELVGLNENAVAQLVFRARERLRTELRLVQIDPESLPEECRTFLPLLAQHLDGKLRGPKLESTLTHLETCERCQAALADMREAKRRYRALLLPPLGMPVDEARAAVADELDRVGYWDGRGSRRGMLRSRGRAGAAAVVGVAALLVGGGLGAATLLAESTEEAARSPVTTEGPPTTGGATAPAGTESAPTTTTPKPKPTPSPPAATTEPDEPTPPTTPVNAPTTAPEHEAAAPQTTNVEPPKRARPKTTPPAPPENQTQPPADTTAPRVSLTGGRTGSTAETTAIFSFTANERGISFACRADDGAWQPCSSPRGVDGLAAGVHTFEVRATDTAGNVGQPAARRWTVTPPPDTTPPTVTFTQVPPASSTARTATFAFSASEPSVTFACSYDGGAFTPCTSPHTVSEAGVDDHSLTVRATDAAGNTGLPATATWVVVAPLPDLIVSLTNTSVTVRNAGEAPAGASLVTVTGVGTFSIQPLAAGQEVTRTYACRSGTIVATADYAKTVTESNEDNNTATRVVTCLGLSG
jgi:Sigma-70, region 4/CARDB